MQTNNNSISKLLSFSIIILLMLGCDYVIELNPNETKVFKENVIRYIRIGDSIYKTKANETTFSSALVYYDSALLFAQKSKRKELIAKANFAKGRAYDAWNHDPLKTIDYFLKAEQFYAQVDSNTHLSYYIGHLIAHTFEKNNDSINAITKELEVLKKIPRINETNASLYRFIPEMAMTCALVNNLDLADEILKNRFNRKYVFNDSLTYNYLDRFYFTQAMIDIKKYNKTRSPYIDSAVNIFRNTDIEIDKVFYGNILINLYTYLNSIKEAESVFIQMPRNEKDINAYIRINKAAATFRSIETSELKRNIFEKERQNRLKNILIGLLSFLIAGVIAALLFIVKNRRKIQSQKLQLEYTNNKLNEKLIEIEWLNKEIHHRVKNNLQIIQGLIYMQENSIDDEKTKGYLLQIRTRIDSIATLHKQLMHQNDNVNLKVYVTNITSTLGSLLSNGKQIITHLDVDDLENTIKMNFTLGLIINELVTNSIKYCNAPQLTINLSIKKVHPNSDILEFFYFDSNSVIEPMRSTSGIGLQIIDLLLAQIKAKKIPSDNQYSCNFKLTLNDRE